MVAKRFADGLTKANTDILDGVMGIDAEIALDAKLEVELSMTSEERQEVVERANSSVDQCDA